MSLTVDPSDTPAPQPGAAQPVTPPAPPADPAPGTPEYDAKMAALGASLDAPFEKPTDAPTPPTAEDRPAWLPAEFKTPEEFAAAYSKLTQKPADQPAPTDTPKDGEPAPDADPNLPQVPGVDVRAMATEFAENGALSDASYEKLAKVGIDKATVDAYIAGQQALADQRSQQGYAQVGGEVQYRQMAEWAKANVPKAELMAFNSQVSGTPEQASLAIAGLYSKFTAATGKVPRLMSGGAPAAGAVSGFQSTHEITTAMSDPRYAADPAYRKSIEARLSVTPETVWG